MKLVKTEVGQRVLKDRSVPLTPRQRSAFILVDGRVTVDYVLAATQAMGVTREDITHLVKLGLLEETPDSQPAPLAPEAPAAEAVRAPAADRTPQQRYQAAYPVATKLTASLGLMGFRLNLAVEQATSYEELCGVAPRIKEAVSANAYRELHRALYD